MEAVFTIRAGVAVMTRRLFALALALGFALPQLALAQTPTKPEPTQEELEKQFSETMTGATLVGTFTIDGVNEGKPLTEDKYTLGKVYKLKNGLWQIEARIQYGDHDVKVPLALTVKWAGDTPVILVTDMPIPGLGTYTSRVMFYRGQYVGTWSGRDHGGLMYGKVVKAGEEVKPADTKPAETKTETKSTDSK
jgi:hypothetical protein